MPFQYHIGEGKFVVTAEELQSFVTMVKSLPNMLTSKVNQAWIQNTIQMVLSMRSITSKNGQIIGKMGHSERFEDGLFQNIPGNKDQHLLHQRFNTLLENKGIQNDMKLNLLMKNVVFLGSGDTQMLQN